MIVSDIGETPAQTQGHDKISFLIMASAVSCNWSHRTEPAAGRPPHMSVQPFHLLHRPLSGISLRRVEMGPLNQARGKKQGQLVSLGKDFGCRRCICRGGMGWRQCKTNLGSRVTLLRRIV